MRNKSYLFLILIILISCNSFDNNEENTFVLSEILIEDIEELIASESFLYAVQSVDYLIRTSDIDNSELEKLRDLAIDGIKSLYQASLARNDYKNILRLYLTLKNITDKEYLKETSEKDILLNIAREYKENDDFVVAVVTFLRVLKRPDADVEDFIEAAEYVYQFNDSASLRLIVSMMEEKNIQIDTKYYEILENYPTTSEMMFATVTIWVDKGTTYEKGIGYPERSLGSGFFIDRRGYILTNYHVIETEVNPEYEGFSRLYIKLPNRVEEKIPAKVVGWDLVFDMALLKVEIEPQFIFNIAADIEVEPGDKVYAIGSPLDPLLENTITSGIVSATSRRHFIQMGDVVQVDAAVNPGNSGGPLLSESGDLIGVIFAGIAPYEGLSFAIASNWIRIIIDDLYNEGKVKHPWLGMVLNKTDDGMEVIYTVPGESAHLAGIETGDIVLSINNIEFDSLIDIHEYILKLPHSSMVSVQWLRDEKVESGLLVLNERPLYPIEIALERDTKANIIYPLFGMKLKEVEVSRWEKRYAVEDIIIGSAADNSGISIDDPVTLKEWFVDEENRVVFLQIYIKKRIEGYINSAMQIAAFIELDSFV
jgi:S1-C subfamily serine protease